MTWNPCYFLYNKELPSQANEAGSGNVETFTLLIIESVRVVADCSFTYKRDHGWLKPIA